MHDFVRDTVRAALVKARPVPQFTTEIRAHATASSRPDTGSPAWEPVCPAWRAPDTSAENAQGTYDSIGSFGFALQAPVPPPISAAFSVRRRNRGRGQRRDTVARGMETATPNPFPITTEFAPPALLLPMPLVSKRSLRREATLESLSTLKPPGTNPKFVHPRGERRWTWIVDQHVAHERVLFERS